MRLTYIHIRGILFPDPKVLLPVRKALGFFLWEKLFAFCFS